MSTKTRLPVSVTEVSESVCHWAGVLKSSDAGILVSKVVKLKGE
jgi:hypothetical protein